MYKYNTDSHIIQHIFQDLLPQIIKKYQFTKHEVFDLLKAKKIMLDKADEINKGGVGGG